MTAVTAVTAAPAVAALTDGYGRRARDLRLSLTDRCSLRCSYCLPAEGVTWLKRSQLLRADEIVRLAGILVGQGIERVRLTGGEPLVRADVVDIVAGLAALTPRPELALTTNGVALARLAGPLAAAGLQRVNISLDTVDRGRYRAVTRRDRLGDVLAGIDAAVAAGLRPVKLNAVLLRGVNDADAATLLDFAVARGCELRFIEQMPLGAAGGWSRAALVTASEVLSLLGRDHELTPLPDRGAAPAARWLVDGGPAAVGVIAAVTEPFCADCERLRLTADGQLRTCLFAGTETDLRTPLRAGADDARLAELMVAAVRAKPAGHGIGRPEFCPPARPMSAIGG
ncbi:MAG: GTP 3',8-cyclase MoaA [Propionibacteriaceae bacterium]|jgi:cyclic pyranopterin phosphate synthase|nr:GTP 3',8-cyclase MoaA [Propionibacteriaceae bacterium]